MPDLTNVFYSFVMTEGPLEGETVLGMRILNRTGPVRYSFKDRAETKARHFQAHDPNHKATVLKGAREIIKRPGPDLPGDASTTYFVGITERSK